MINKKKEKEERKMKKETWKIVIQMMISVLTAIATTLGMTSM